MLELEIVPLVRVSVRLAAAVVTLVAVVLLCVIVDNVVAIVRVVTVVAVVLVRVTVDNDVANVIVAVACSSDVVVSNVVVPMVGLLSESVCVVAVVVGALIWVTVDRSGTLVVFASGMVMTESLVELPGSAPVLWLDSVVAVGM
jgi:hypothetical protein